MIYKNKSLENKNFVLKFKNLQSQEVVNLEELCLNGKKLLKKTKIMDSFCKIT